MKDLAAFKEFEIAACSDFSNESASMVSTELSSTKVQHCMVPRSFTADADCACHFSFMRGQPAA